jgi:hypothetical protein
MQMDVAQHINLDAAAGPPRQRPTCMSYSPRSARTGSMRLARRAGR